MADTHLSRLVRERRKRLVATVLGHAEREFYSQLSEEQQAAFREKVITSIDDFADFVRDIIKVTGEDVVVNAHVVEILEALHSNQRTLLTRLAD
jgi:hypothetical protein